MGVRTQSRENVPHDSGRVPVVAGDLADGHQNPVTAHRQRVVPGRADVQPLRRR
jgi:hypothetical protein